MGGFDCFSSWEPVSIWFWRQGIVFVIFHGGFLGFQHDQPERFADLLESCPTRIDIQFGQQSAGKFHRVPFEKPCLDIAHLDNPAMLGYVFFDSGGQIV